MYVNMEGTWWGQAQSHLLNWSFSHSRNPCCTRSFVLMVTGVKACVGLKWAYLAFFLFSEKASIYGSHLPGGAYKKKQRCQGRSHPRPVATHSSKNHCDAVRMYLSSIVVELWMLQAGWYLVDVCMACIRGHPLVGAWWCQSINQPISWKIQIQCWPEVIHVWTL